VNAVVADEYVALPVDVMRRMLSLADLKKGETLYVPSCGSGDLLILAAQEYGARGVGIERSRALAGAAREVIREKGLEDRIEIVCDNYLFPRYWAHLGDADNKPHAFRNADVVAYYLSLYIQEQLRRKLENELRPGARVVSYAFKLMGWEPVKVDNIKRHDTEVPIYVFEKGKSF
jgi:hypothetical protein